MALDRLFRDRILGLVQPHFVHLSVYGRRKRSSEEDKTGLNNAHEGSRSEIENCTYDGAPLANRCWRRRAGRIYLQASQALSRSIKFPFPIPCLCPHKFCVSILFA